MSIRISIPNPSKNKKQNKHKNGNKTVSEEDREVLLALEQLKDALSITHQSLDYVTNPLLIDSYIYEIKSLHMKYQYYLKICKERGLCFSNYSENN